MTKKNETTTKEIKANINVIESALEKANIKIDEVSLHSNSFKFSFSFPNGNYFCLFKTNLKGIATEECEIDGKKFKVGIKKFCKLAKFNEDVAKELLVKRNQILKSIRGDKSDTSKIEFEIKEIEEKIKTYEEKIKNLQIKAKEKEVELKESLAFEKNNKIDTKELKEKAKKMQIEKLQKELEALKS